MVLTFLAPVLVADIILPVDGELRTTQMDGLCAISVLWVERGGNRLEISTGKNSWLVLLPHAKGEYTVKNGVY